MSCVIEEKVASQGLNSAVWTLLSMQTPQKVDMEVENSSQNLNLPESKSPVVKQGQVSSERRTRSQTGAVRREPLKKALNFVSKKSRVYGKNQVKKSKKRKRLKNADAGVVALPKRRKGNAGEAMDKALVVDLEVLFCFFLLFLLCIMCIYMMYMMSIFICVCICVYDLCIDDIFVYMMCVSFLRSETLPSLVPLVVGSHWYVVVCVCICVYDVCV